MKRGGDTHEECGALTRIYVQEELEGSHTVLLTGPQRRYLCTVLRIRPGDQVIVFDRSGGEYTARFTSADRKAARLTILGRHRSKTESTLRLILAQALLKAEKMEMVIQKAVELGAKEFYPFTCDRVVPVPHPHRETTRIDRWRRIALEASQQCGRTVIPEVGRIIPFQEVLSKRPSVDLGLLFSFQGQITFGQLACQVNPPASVLVIVGPEGGFSELEVSMAVEKGFVPVSLGARTLRAETAGILAVGLVQFQFGDLR